MSQNMNFTQNLRYGSFIRIGGKGNNATKGIITSKGFFDHAVYFQTYEDMDDINNFRDGIFQILPRGSFEIHDEYLKGMDKSPSLQQRMKSEKEQYFNMIDNKMNEEHVESGQYLACSEECSDSRSDSFGLRLQQFLSSRIIFKMEPSKSYQQTGRPIISKQSVKIQSDINKFWIDKNMRQPVQLDHKSTQAGLKVQLKALQEDSHRYELIVSHYSDSEWKIQLYDNYEKHQLNKLKLKTNEVVTFKCPKTETYLGADLQNNQIVLKPTLHNQQIPVECLWELQFQDKIISEFPTITLQPRTLAQIRHSFLGQNNVLFPGNQMNQQYNQKNATEQNQQFNNQQKFKKNLSKQLRLRHVITGKLLFCQDLFDADDCFPAILSDDSCTIGLQLANRYEREFIDSSYVNLVRDDNVLASITTKQSMKTSSDVRIKKSEKIQGTEGFYKQLNQEQSTVKCGFRDRAFGKPFIIHRVKQSFFKLVLQPFSAYDLMLNFVYQLQQNPLNFSYVISPERMYEIQFLLNRLHEYLMDKIDISDENLDDLPIFERQIILKELYFTEILVELLYYLCYKKGTKKLQIWRKQKEQIQMIFQSAYQLMTKLIQNNIVTKLYVSQWLEMFLHQYMSLSQPAIQSFISEMLDNNREAIQKFLTENIIKKLIELIMQQSPHDKYLKILNAICVSSNQAIRENQRLVLENFFKVAPPNFKFAFKIKQGHIFIQSAEQLTYSRWQNLEQFYKSSVMNDNLEYWNYFISYFDLLGDVAMNRFLQAKEFIDENYSLEIFCKILHEAQSFHMFNLMKPFLKLIRYAYIDTPPFQKFKKLRVIQFKDLHGNFIDHSTMLPKTSPLLDVMGFLLQQLEKIDLLHNNIEYSKNLQSVLQLLKCSIEMQFWVDMDQIKVILTAMYNICSSIKNFNMNRDQIETPNPQSSSNNSIHLSKIYLTEEKETHIHKKIKSTRLNETNNIFMTCKQLACEIINTIFDLENNIRVFMCSKSFKEQLLQLELVDPNLANINNNPQNAKQSNILDKLPKNNQAILQVIQQKFKNQIVSEEKSLYDITNWINQFRQIVTERSLSNFENFELIFAELSFYENLYLPKYSLEILSRAYGQRKELIQNFEKVIIVVSGKTLELSQLTKQIMKKLDILYQYEFYTMYKETSNNIRTSLIWYHSNEHQKAGLIQNLFQLGLYLKKDFDKGRSLNPLNFEDYKPDNNSTIAFCEREQNYKLHQAILMAEQIHVPLLNFIQKFNIDYPTIYWKLLHSIYDFLTILIWNNSENKQVIMNNKQLIQSLEQHLKFNIGTIDFLKALYADNKALLYSEREMTFILQSVVPVCNDLSINNYFKSKTLDFIKALLLSNSNYITSNQTQILQKLQEKQFNKIILLFNIYSEQTPISPEENSFSDITSSQDGQTDSETVITEELFKKWIEDYQKGYENIGYGFHELYISPELTYLYSFFAVFSQLVEEKHQINIKKCLKIHKFHDLVVLLYQAQDCWPLKRHLRAYINRLYYIKASDNFDLIIKIDLLTIIDDLQKIIDYLILPQHSYMAMTIIKAPIRYKYLMSYIYLNLEEILISLNSLFLNESFLEYLEELILFNQQNQIYKLHFQLFEICQKLLIIEKIYVKENLGHLCQLLLDVFQSIISGFDTKVLLMRESLYLSMVEEMLIFSHLKLQNQQDLTKTQINKLYQIQRNREIYKQLLQNSNDQSVKQYLVHQVFSLDQQFMKETKLQNTLEFWKTQSKNKNKSSKSDMNDLINHKLRRIMNNWSFIPQFSQFLDEEFYEVCNKLSQIGKQSQDAYQTKYEVTTLQDFIQNIISICANTREQQFSDDIRIFFLRLLSRLITEKNLSNKQKMVEVDLWTSEFWIDYKQEINHAQNLLTKCGAQDLILLILSESFLEINLTLLNECLLFSIAFLLGGNTQAQNAILEKLKQDSQNQILINIKIIITKLTKVINNNFSMVTHHNTKGCDFIQTVDNFDFYNTHTKVMQRVNVVDPDDYKETNFKKQCLDVLCRFFRVMQLLCENNNSEMKEFFRRQTDEQNITRINSINFIEFTSVQLRAYLKILSRAIIIIPASILDFINEVIQLPCIENQITLCHTTFFEDVSNMAHFFTNKSNQLQRLFDTEDDLQELQELFNKILQTVLLVLEGNEEKIYKDIQNKLEASFLISFLSLSFEQLNIENINDLEIYLLQQDKIFNSDMLRILNVCIIEQKMASYQQSRWIQQFHEQLSVNPTIKDIYDNLIVLIHHIEIVYEGKSMTVFFPYHQLFNLLSEQSKQDLLFQINRETQRDKLLGLLSATNILFYELEHNYKLNHYRIPITQNNLNVMQNLSSILALLINLSMIFFYTVVVKGNTYLLTSTLYNSLIIKMLSVSQLFSQIILFIMVSFQRIPIYLKKNSKGNDKLSLLLVIIQEDTCLLLFLLVLLSFFGAFINSTVFVIHLVEIFSRVTILKNVFQAISYNAKQLLVVAFLGVLFVFAFSVISFSVYFDDIYQEEQTETCDSLITCMITLITSGVIGNSMINWDPLKFFFDMLFTVFFGLLFTNIVQGIMIDTFAELRDQRQKIEEDIKNRCFICAAQRGELENKNQSFEQHIQDKHLIWNYVFYVKCLWLKEWTEYTGLEYWIYEKIKQDDTSWFPESVIDGKNITERLDQIESLLSQVIVCQENNS
ncbi:unnamed protein product [Paramecium sonneborni]|uniref:Uncharacterized protein n=1 Tax=Paramecium sonneborni TaxID=65129 RepID=A0A8S1KEK2_9CILI|nr:unnamed protein product [Paramecium sonneborni]